MLRKLKNAAGSRSSLRLVAVVMPPAAVQVDAVVEVHLGAELDVLGPDHPHVILDRRHAARLQEQLVRHAAQADANQARHPAEQALQRLAHDVMPGAPATLSQIEAEFADHGSITETPARGAP
jgi:hypothetical protein